MNNCFFSLPKYILINIAFEWLALNCICKTDTANTSTKFRSSFLNKIIGARIFQHTICIGCHPLNLFLKWCLLRSVQCTSLKVEIKQGRSSNMLIKTSRKNILENFFLNITNHFIRNATLKTMVNTCDLDGNYSFLSLVALNCSRSSLLDERSLSTVKHTPNLQTINLRKCYLVQDKDVTWIAESCKQLTDVNFSCCYSVTEVGVSSLLDNCTNLTALNVFDCNLVMVKLFTIIGSTLRSQLRSLDMGCFRLGRKASMRQIYFTGFVPTACFPNLHYFNLSGRFEMTHNVVQPILRELTRLLSLDTRGWTIKSEEALDLIRNSQLETFIFTHNQLDSYPIETVVPSYTNLTHLQYSGRKFHKIEHLQAIVNSCVKLRVFDVTFYSHSRRSLWFIDSEILTMATNCHTTLTEFHLHNNCEPRMSFETLQSVIQMCGSSLRVLDVSHVNTPVNRSNAKLFAQRMPNLKSMILIDMICANANVIELAVQCRNLTVLNLSHRTVSNKALIVVAKLCESLRSLTLKRNERLRDAGIISFCVHRGSSLTSLSLMDNMPFTDIAMKSIAEHCVNLEKLDISVCYKWLRMVTFSNVVILVRNCGAKLRHLTITQQIGCTDYCVKHIAQHCHQLTHLTITNRVRGHSNYCANYFLSTPLNCPLLRYLKLSLSVVKQDGWSGDSYYDKRVKEIRGELFVWDWTFS